MSDHWIKEAERRGDELSNFGDWVNDNEYYIIECYIDRLELDDIPDDFINNLYNSRLED